MPNGAIVALDAGDLLGLTGLDMVDGDARVSARISSLPPMYSGPLSTLMVRGLRGDDPVKATDDRSAGRE